MTQRVVNYTYGTGNPVLPDGSIDVRDGIDNLQSLDIFMNAPEDTYNQRDDKIVRTVAGMNNEFDAQILNMGFTRIGTFASGATLTNPRQTLLWDVAYGGDGQEYGWSGAFPKVVPASSTPLTTGGIAVGAWISRFDPELRNYVLNTTTATFKNDNGYSAVENMIAGRVNGVAGAVTHIIGNIYSTGGTTWECKVDGASEIDDFEPLTSLHVTDFGAVVDATTSSSAAFSSAAKAAAASNISQADYIGVPQAEYAEVRVPAGKYLLDAIVDVDGRMVTWVADAGANFINPDNLNGRLLRDGVRVNNFSMSGILDGSCGFSVANYRKAESPGGVLGVTAPNQLAIYTDRDTVGFYADNYAQKILASVATATYSSTGVTLGTALTADQIKRLRVGMIIDTKHTPTKYTGIITAWAADGTSLTVEGWYLADGVNTPHSKVTPPNTAGVDINPATKAWAINANVFIDAQSHARDVAACELGVSNDKFDYDPATDSWHSWCYDAITLGSKRCETAYMQRGYYYKGFESRGATGYAFTAKNAGGVWADRAVYHSQANSDKQIHIEPDVYGGKTSYTVTREGNMDIGRTDAAQTTFIDFHSSGNLNDYDARISVTGGSATVGQGNMTVTGGIITYSPGFQMSAGDFRPIADLGRNLGTASFRWNTVYAGVGAINTSDVRTKTFLAIDDAERAAALEIKGMMRKFQFNAAIAEKGTDGARWHFGVGAQEVGAVLSKHGLDPDKYAFFCFDSWEAEYEDVYAEFDVETEVDGVIDEPVYLDGVQVSTKPTKCKYIVKTVESRPTGEKKLVREAGELYGIRYDELVCFILAAL